MERMTAKGHGFENGTRIAYYGDSTKGPRTEPIMVGTIERVAYQGNYMTTDDGKTTWIGGSATKFWAVRVDDTPAPAIRPAARPIVAVGPVANVAASLATVEAAPADYYCDCGYVFIPAPGDIVCPSCRMDIEAAPSAPNAYQSTIRELHTLNRVKAEADLAAEIAKRNLIRAVAAASATVSEYTLATELGVTRSTVRAWLGK